MNLGSFGNLGLLNQLDLEANGSTFAAASCDPDLASNGNPTNDDDDDDVTEGFHLFIIG